MSNIDTSHLSDLRTEADLLAADLNDLERRFTETVNALRIHREALSVALEMLHNAAKRILEQEDILRKRIPHANGD